MLAISGVWKKLSIVFSCLIFVGFYPAQVTAQQERPIATQQLPITLRECLALALENNLDIIIARHGPQVAETQIVEEKANFHPLASIDFTKENKDTPLPASIQTFTRARPEGPLTAIENETWDFNWGITQRFVTGSEYQVSFHNLRDANTYNRFHSEYVTNTFFTFKQHLLRNFGLDVNKTEINIARNNRDISQYEFLRQVLDILAQVEKTYWDLVFSIEDLEVKKKSLELAKDLLNRNRIQVEVGTLAPIEILEAETQVAAREEDIIRAEKVIKDNEDRLRKLINLPDLPLLKDVKIIPKDKPTFQKIEVSLEKSVQEALKERPEYLQAKKNIDNRHLQLKFSKNQLLPTVDLVAGIGTLANQGNFGNSLQDIISGDNEDWRVGITIEIPIGNQLAKSRYTKARIEAERAIFELENIKQNIIIEVKEAVRQIETNIKRVEATRISSRLHQERLDAEEKRFSVGLSTSRDVLEDQEQLSEALSRELLAIIDYNKSLVNLERAKGTLFKSRKINILSE
jgi:outer membrane protein TolC